VNKTWVIARHEFVTTVKKVSYIILTLSLPVLVILGMLVYYGITQWAGEKPPTEKPSIGYIDDTGLFDEYTNTDNVNFVPYVADDEAKQELLNGNISEYFIIPADYLDTGTVYRYTTKREIEPPASLNSIEDFLITNLISTNVSNDILTRVNNPLYAQSFRLNQDTGEIGICYALCLRVALFDVTVLCIGLSTARCIRRKREPAHRNIAVIGFR